MKTLIFMDDETLSRVQEAFELLGVLNFHDLEAEYKSRIDAIAKERGEWDPDDEKQPVNRVRAIVRSIGSYKLDHKSWMSCLAILSYPLPRLR